MPTTPYTTKKMFSAADLLDDFSPWTEKQVLLLSLGFTVSTHPQNSDHALSITFSGIWASH